MHHLRLDVRLSATERALVTDLQAALATTLLPNVTASDVIRAGIRALAANLQVAAGVR